ncbi:MAG: vitamin K epoxide reductase family protein [Gaiellaceae bacterium]
MSDGALRGAVAALSLAGIAVTGYLLWARWMSTELLCSTGGCETVQSSSYAELLGVPVVAVGLVGYVLLGLTALRTEPLVRAAVMLDAVCQWCLASDATTALIAAATLLRLRGVALTT